MTKNPLVNALAAATYIAAISCLLFFGLRSAQPEDSILMPITMLSLLTLSAAVMAFLFFYQPITLLSKGEHASALKLLLSTIGFFAVITVIFLGIFFSISFF